MGHMFNLLGMLVTNTVLVDALHNMGDSAMSWESNKLATTSVRCRVRRWTQVACAEMARVATAGNAGIDEVQPQHSPIPIGRGRSEDVHFNPVILAMSRETNLSNTRRPAAD
jgi:hypothetical protein